MELFSLVAPLYFRPMEPINSDLNKWDRVSLRRAHKDRANRLGQKEILVILHVELTSSKSGSVV